MRPISRTRTRLTIKLERGARPRGVGETERVVPGTIHTNLVEPRSVVGYPRALVVYKGVCRLGIGHRHVVVHGQREGRLSRGGLARVYVLGAGTVRSSVVHQCLRITRRRGPAALPEAWPSTVLCGDVRGTCAGHLGEPVLQDSRGAAVKDLHMLSSGWLSWDKRL